MVYAQILIERMKATTKLDFDYFCYTDRPAGVASWATPLPLEIKSVGWWNKVNIFGKLAPPGPTLYMDIDIVIANNFDNEILWSLDHLDKICCVSDAINWKNQRFNSSLMCFRPESTDWILKRFQSEYDDAINTEGGDQIWLGPLLKNVCYLDEKFPLLKRNLKFHIGEIQGTNISLPTSIDPRIKLIDCSGRPKPHELAELKYIYNNWHAFIPNNSCA